MLLTDRQIVERANSGMIAPFEPEQVREIISDNHVDTRPYRVISYGTSSAGYDMRMSDELLIATPPALYDEIVDPKKPNSNDFRQARFQASKDGVYFVLPPYGFALTSSLEYFKIPPDILGDVRGKSTYARFGIHVLVTPLEPGWEGNVTIEISNLTPWSVRVYTLEGIAQVLFHQLSERPQITYADKNGKYQGQTGITLGRV